MFQSCGEWTVRINDSVQSKRHVNLSNFARSCSLRIPRHATPTAISFKHPGRRRKPGLSRAGRDLPKVAPGVSRVLRSLRDFQGPPPPCPPGGTLLIKPLQKAEGRGLERPEPPRSCCPGRLLGPEPRANAFQEGIRIFLCDVEGEIDSIASEHGAKRRERTAPSGKRRPSRPGSAKHLQFN